VNTRPLRLLAAAIAATVSIYSLMIRPWMKRWGATDDELLRSLPGDELLSSPQFEVTRSITVEATPEKIWPWLVQLGQGRGGFYSYDWLENLFHLDIHTLDEIVPELQALQVNDCVPFAPQEGAGMMVATLDPQQVLVLYAPHPPYEETHQQQRDEPAFDMQASWAFVLDPVDERTTRLIVRFRASYTPNPMASVLFAALLEPAHFIMERKMLLGIKERAEKQRESDIPPPTPLAGVA
jgi:hypothetical protein